MTSYVISVQQNGIQKQDNARWRKKDLAWIQVIEE